MRRALLAALVALIAIGAAGSAGAATLDFTGNLRLQIGTHPDVFPPFDVPGAGTAQLTDDGSFHLLSLFLPGGTFGPIATSLPNTLLGSTPSIRLTLAGNLTGSFGGISGGPPGGGSMGLQGIAKICLIFDSSCQVTFSPFPLTPTPSGSGFGIGGTVVVPGAVSITMQNMPWTLGQPAMTIHTPYSSVTTPALPGGFAHGPASLTSSTARPSGAVQLVTVSKVFTSLTSGWPEIPLTGVLTLHFVPEPSALLMLGSGIAALAIYGRRRPRE